MQAPASPPQYHLLKLSFFANCMPHYAEIVSYCKKKRKKCKVAFFFWSRTWFPSTMIAITKFLSENYVASFFAYYCMLGRRFQINRTYSRVASILLKVPFLLVSTSWHIKITKLKMPAFAKAWVQYYQFERL